MNFVKLYIGDYQRDTGHLSIAEHGAYLLMLQHFYATEKPLPTGKALHRLLRAESKAEREAIDAVVAAFWIDEGAGLVNRRALDEIRKADHQRTVNREQGKKGGNPYLKEQYDEAGTLYAARLPDGRIKVGITAGPWSKRAYGLAKVYGGRPEPLALIEVENMGRAEAEVLAEFAAFADGEVLTLPDERTADLLANLQAKGVAKVAEVRQPNREAIVTPNQTPDTRHQTKPKPLASALPSSVEPGLAGALSRALRAKGIASNPMDPRLQALAEAGTTPQQAMAAADAARDVKGPNARIPPAYVLAILERWRTEPAAIPAAAQDPNAAAAEALRMLEQRDAEVRTA